MAGKLEDKLNSPFLKKKVEFATHVKPGAEPSIGSLISSN
jgi:hypothetical protein